MALKQKILPVEWKAMQPGYHVLRGQGWPRRWALFIMWAIERHGLEIVLGRYRRQVCGSQEKLETET